MEQCNESLAGKYADRQNIYRSSSVNGKVQINLLKKNKMRGIGWRDGLRNMDVAAIETDTARKAVLEAGTGVRHRKVIIDH